MTPFTRQRKHVPFTGPSKAAILSDPVQGWIRLVTPYKADFVDELKNSIAPSHRQWDAIGKVWRVSDIYLEEVIGMMKRYFSEVITDLNTPKGNEVAVPNDPASLFAELFKVLPEEHQERVYKTLAVALHPDHGGNPVTMSQLNKAYQERKS